MNFSYVASVIFCLTLTGCNPTIRIGASDKPIEINLNIKHEILVKVEKDVQELLNNDELF